MIIKAKNKRFICINGHPTGCAVNVAKEIEEARAHVIAGGPLNVLVIGSSNGFGLSSRITAAYSMGANTMGIFSSKPPREKREATSGWYNSYALTKELEKLPTTHINLNADAFAPETKEAAIRIIKERFPEGIDLVVYSIAAARRTVGEETFKSAIKPIGQPVKTWDLNLDTGIVSEVELHPGTEEEIESTKRVMGGEDWQLWIEALSSAGLLKEDNRTFSYTYIGSSHTRAIYNEGTIGNAKDHLLTTARAMNEKGLTKAFVISQPAVITQSSSVIPSISLYMTILMDIYREKAYDNSSQTHTRNTMLEAFLKDPDEVLVINNGYELSDEIQAEVNRRWDRIRAGEALPAENGDPAVFREAFLNNFGFELDEVDYEKDVDHYLIFEEPQQ